MMLCDRAVRRFVLPAVLRARTRAQIDVFRARAPTAASARGMCENGSKRSQRSAFSCPIFAISASLHFASEKCSNSSSGDPGKLQSECG